MTPMNIMNQNSIDEHGNIIGKDRLIHNQSYKWSSGTSVNSRIKKGSLLACKFAGCIKQLVNWVVAARQKYPNQRILASKSRLHISLPNMPFKCQDGNSNLHTAPGEKLAVVALRLTFGGAPGPYKWGVMSESMCNLAMAILHDNNWKPDNLYAPNSDLVLSKNVLGKNIPFRVGKN